MTFRQLRYFVAVAESGTVSEAARVCNVSQPSVSAAVMQLEELLGARLFQRKQSTGMVLTARGEKCLREAREMLARASNFMSQEASELTELSGTLSLAYFKDVGPYYVPRLVAAFLGSFAQVEFTFLECTLGDVEQALTNQKAELAITYNLNLRNSIERKVLATLPPYVMLSARHPLAGEESIDLATLSREPLILESLPVTLEYFRALFWAKQLEPNVRMQTSTFEMQRGLVAHGLGVALSCTRPAGDLSYDGEPIRCIPLSDDIVPPQVVLASVGQARSPLAQALWEFVIDASRFGTPVIEASRAPS